MEESVNNKILELSVEGDRYYIEEKYKDVFRVSDYDGDFLFCVQCDFQFVSDFIKTYLLGFKRGAIYGRKMMANDFKQLLNIG
jgi:hypothetical protein